MTAHIGATLESLMGQDLILGGAARDLGTNQEFIKQVVSHAHSSLQEDVRRSIVASKSRVEQLESEFRDVVQMVAAFATVRGAPGTGFGSIDLKVSGPHAASAQRRDCSAAVPSAGATVAESGSLGPKVTKTPAGGAHSPGDSENRTGRPLGSNSSIPKTETGAIDWDRLRENLGAVGWPIPIGAPFVQPHAPGSVSAQYAPGGVEGVHNSTIRTGALAPGDGLGCGQP